MIKLAGTLPVKSRLPLSAWLLAALVTVFSFASWTNAGTKPNQDSPIASQENQSSQEAHANVLGVLAHLADVLTWPG
jgi:hypothetical protein